jgi:hypothetical protein
MSWGSVSTHGCQPTMDVSSWHAFLPPEPCGSSLSMIVTFHCPRQRTIDWCNHPDKKEPTPSSAAIYWVNVQLPLPRNTRSFWMARYLHSHTTTSVNCSWTALVYAEMPCAHKRGNNKFICVAGMASEKLLRRWDWYLFISIIIVRSSLPELVLNHEVNFWTVIKEWGSVAVLRVQSGVKMLPNLWQGLVPITRLSVNVKGKGKWIWLIKREKCLKMVSLKIYNFVIWYWNWHFLY